MIVCAKITEGMSDEIQIYIYSNIFNDSYNNNLTMKWLMLDQTKFKRLKA
jgi:hypothetical protein